MPSLQDYINGLPQNVRDRFQGMPTGGGGGDWRGGGGGRDWGRGTIPPGFRGGFTPPPTGGGLGRGNEPWRGYTPQPVGQDLPGGTYNYGGIPGQAPVYGGAPATSWADVARGRFAPMPQFLTPSAQYWNQMGPTAQQQYQGYAQATMGWLPEESLWRQRMIAPPGGQPINVNWR